MQKPKRVLCLMDVSVVGRSSMASVLPVLAACGVQGCPLPTMLFSTHTGGFGVVEREEAAGFARRALSHYRREQVAFDAVYTGYLASDAQFEAARAALELWPGALKVVDPAMADSGRLYSGLPENTPARMAELARHADLITPNLTEARLMSGRAGDSPAALLERLSAGGRGVLLTSVQTPEGATRILGREAGGAPFELPVDQQPQSYPGTGDLFTAALIGLLLNGQPLPTAAAAAAAFITAAVRATLQGGGEPRHGVWYEPHLPLLSAAALG